MVYRRIICALAIIGALVLASLRGGDIVYMILRITLLLPVASMAYTYYVYNNFSVMQKISGRSVVREEPVEMRIELQNDTANIFPVIEVRFYDDRSELPEYGKSTMARLHAKEKQVIETPVICHRRGKYRIGARKVVVTDLLGIMKISYPIQENYDVSVFPRVVELSSLSLFSLEGSREIPLQFGTDMVLDNAVRDYVPGDDPRRIHWKSSAKMGTLKTRESTFPVRPPLYILMQMAKPEGKNGEALEDEMIEASLALANYSYRNSTGAVCLYSPSGQPEMSVVESADTFNSFYDICCDISFSGTPAMGKLFALADEATCCAVIASQVDNKIVDSIRLMSANGTKCALLFASEDEGKAEALRDAMDAIGAEFRHIRPGCRLTDLLW